MIIYINHKLGKGKVVRCKRAFNKALLFFIMKEIGYLSQMLNNGFDPDFVRTQAGHKDLRTTLTSYVYATERPETQIQKLNDLFAAAYG